MEGTSTVQHRVHPSTRYIWLFIAGFLVLLALKVLMLGALPWFTPVWRVMVLVGGLLLVYLYLARITTIYEITPLEVAMEEGIFSKVRRTAPLTRITNFEMVRPWYKRILGIADLLVDTAGSSDVELRLEEMALKDAQTFSAAVSRHLHTGQPAGGHT